MVMDKATVKDFILNIAVADSSQSELFAILFSHDTYIDKQRLLGFLFEKIDTNGELSPDDRVAIDEEFNDLEKNKLDYDLFIVGLKNKLLFQIRKSLDYKRLTDGAFDTLTPEVFWPMMVIAMKKCLGSKNARAKITDRNHYFDLVSEELNLSQEKTHNKCIDYFSNNADVFSISTNSELRKYLHPFKSKNRRLKTQKKNLRRVEKRINKIMQVYKISHDRIDGNIFSRGRYKVPEQFADCIRKIYLTAR